MIGLLASSIVGLGLSGGLGSTYDYAGVRADFRVWHVSLSAAVGISGVSTFDDASYGTRNVDFAPALGLRVFTGEDDGLFAAVTRSAHGYERSYDNPVSFDRSARMVVVTVTLGWRFRWSAGWFLDLAAGAGESTFTGHPSATGIDSIPGPFRRWKKTIPDFALGFGFEL